MFRHQLVCGGQVFDKCFCANHYERIFCQQSFSHRYPRQGVTLLHLITELRTANFNQRAVIHYAPHQANCANRGLLCHRKQVHCIAIKYRFRDAGDPIRVESFWPDDSHIVQPWRTQPCKHPQNGRLDRFAWCHKITRAAGGICQATQMGFGWAAANAHDKDPMTRGISGINGWVDGADFTVGHQ